MITDQDVEKLQETFATKDHLSDELKRYATQDSLDQLSNKVDGIQEEVGDLRVEVAEIKEKIDSLDSKFDGMIGLLEASLQEHGAGAAHLARHDRQIGILAAAAGVTLPQ